MTSAFENMMSGEEVVAFAPPKSGSYEPLDPPNLPLVEEPRSSRSASARKPAGPSSRTFSAGPRRA